MDLKSLAFWREGGLTYVDLVFWTGLLLYVFVYRRYADRIIPSLTNKNDSTPLSPVIEQESESASPSNAKPSRNKKQWKPTKTNYSHPYLAANLMGHTGKIMSMDCSNDGKYMVACAEDELPLDPGEGSISGSEASKVNRSPSESPGGSAPGSPTSTRRSARRRRKHRAAKTEQQQQQQQRPIIDPQLPPCPGPLFRYEQLKFNENDLYRMLSYYTITSDKLVTSGYPIACSTDPFHAIVYCIEFAPQKKFDVNAREFVPKSTAWSREEDSGQGSGSSSPRSPESDPDSEEERTKSVERKCARCLRGFFLTSDGEYLTTDRCRHHWGRLQRAVNNMNIPPTIFWSWACCGAGSKAGGCDRAPLHVWSGLSAGFNGPLDGYVQTKPRNPKSPARLVLALDCEMCYTAAGLQVARLEVISADGCRVYGCYVTPSDPIIDYNTRFSGICAQDMQKATKSLKDVQNDLLELMDAETILVGHGLENDLRALKILHGRLVDTAIVFPHERGFPFRRSLKSLAEMHLQCNVQESQHCPLEDARVSLDLMLWRIQHDLIMESA